MRFIEWLKEDGKVQGFVRDLIVVAVMAGAICAISQITLGVWTPMVAVESGSMEPNMNIGDIVFIQGSSRSEINTWDEGEITGYEAFNKSGDVILYRPYGKEKLGLLDQFAHLLLRQPYPQDKATPIIHRAMRYVEEGEPMWEGGPPAPFSGYITKGDNNAEIDQKAGEILGTVDPRYFMEQQVKGDLILLGNNTYLDRETGLPFIQSGNETLAVWGINYGMPVKDDWVIGIARFRVPYVGYIRLLPNIIVDKIRETLT